MNDFLDFLPTIPIIDVRRQLGGDKRAPRDSQSNSPILLHARGYGCQPVHQNPICADKAMPGSEPVDHFLESLPGETLLSSRVLEIPEIDNESAGNEYGPVSLSGAP